MDEQISESGIFFDTQTQKVVEGQPQEGVQIVAPGGVVDANAQAEVKRYLAIEAGTESTPGDVTTASMSRTEDASAPPVEETAVAPTADTATEPDVDETAAAAGKGKAAPKSK